MASAEPCRSNLCFYAGGDSRWSVCIWGFEGTAYWNEFAGALRSSVLSGMWGQVRAAITVLQACGRGGMWWLHSGFVSQAGFLLLRQSWHIDWMWFVSVLPHCASTMTCFYFSAKLNGFDPKEEKNKHVWPLWVLSLLENSTFYEILTVAAMAEQKVPAWFKTANKKTNQNTESKKKMSCIFLWPRKNSDTEQNVKQHTLTVFSSGFGLNASAFEHKWDIIRFLLTFICENTFLLPTPPTRSYSRLFSLTSEEESLRCSVASALCDLPLIVNNHEPAEGNVVCILHTILKSSKHISTNEIASENFLISLVF